MPLIFNADPPPNVTELCREAELRPEQIAHPFRALREDLERVPVSQMHHVNYSKNVLVRNIFVKQVAHRVHEDHPRCGPAQWFGQLFRNQSQVESLFIRVSWDSPKPFSKGLRIAVSASRADFRASTYWVPRGVGPFDAGTVAHWIHPPHIIHICTLHAPGHYFQPIPADS